MLITIIRKKNVYQNKVSLFQVCSFYRFSSLPSGKCGYYSPKMTIEGYIYIYIYIYTCIYIYTLVQVVLYNESAQ